MFRPWVALAALLLTTAAVVVFAQSAEEVDCLFEFDGTPCNDGRDETLDDICLQGRCVGFKPDPCKGVVCPITKECIASSECRQGQCIYNLANEGAMCVDDEGWTGRCSRNGTCIGHRTPVMRTDGGTLAVYLPTGGDFEVHYQTTGSSHNLRKIIDDIERIDITINGVESQLQDSLEDSVDDLQSQIDVITSVSGPILSGQASLEDVATDLDDRKAERTELAALNASLVESIAQVAAQGQEYNASLTDQIEDIRQTASGLRDDVTVLQGHASTLFDLADNTSQILATKADHVETKAYIDSTAERLDKRINETNDRIDVLQEQLNRVFGLVRVTFELALTTDHITQDEFEAEFTKACQSEKLRYDRLEQRCAPCTYTFDEDSRFCTGTSSAFHVMPGRIDTATCNPDGPRTTSNILGGFKYNAFRTGTYRIYFKAQSYLYGDLNCATSDNRALTRVFPKIDGAQLNPECELKFLNGVSQRENQWEPLVCSFTYHFEEGEHSINFDQVGYGRNSIVAGDDRFRSLVHVDYIPDADPTPAPESRPECFNSTSNVLVNTRLKDTVDVAACNAAGYVVLDTELNQAGPYTVRSNTGRIRVYFKARIRLQMEKACLDGETWAEILPVIDGNRETACARNLDITQDSTVVKHSTLVCDFTLDADPNKDVTIGFEFGYYGSGVTIYGDEYSSHILIEEMPFPNAVLAPYQDRQCEGSVRYVLVHDYLRQDDYLRDLCTVDVYKSLDFFGVGPYNISIAEDNTRVRIYFKTSSYNHGSNQCTSDFTAYSMIHPVINGIRQSYCDYTYARGWGRPEYRQSPLVCDMILSLNKGTHTIGFEHRGRGRQTFLLGGRFLSQVIIEAVPAEV